MALTRELDLPSAPSTNGGGFIRRLVSHASENVASVIKEHRPMEFAFLFMVVATFVLELFRSSPSWEWWVAMLFTFVGSFIQHASDAMREETKVITTKEEK